MTSSCATLEPRTQTELNIGPGDHTTTIETRWAQTHRALAGLDAEDNLDTYLRHQSMDRKDEVLLSLIIIAQTTDRRAGDAVLQLMMAAVLSHRRALSSERQLLTRAALVENTYDGLLQAATAAMWESIQTYPTSRRPHRVAKNLEREAWRALSQPRTEKHLESPWQSLTLPSGTSPNGVAEATHRPVQEPAPPADTSIGATITPDSELTEVLTWAASEHIITADDVRLLKMVYCRQTKRGAVDQAATQFDTTAAAVRQRCSRATRRIATAVHADLNGGSLPRLAKAS